MKHKEAMAKKIERAARALYEHDLAVDHSPWYKSLLYGDPPAKWEGLADPVQEVFRAQARAAICGLMGWRL